MVRNRMLRVEDTVWEEFQKIANEEGRFLGKILEMLINSYRTQEEVKLNDEMFKM